MTLNSESTTAPLVSVCIPAYRGANYIGATIESVLAQSLKDFELLIVDDFSPDGTADIVTRYSDKRIRFLRNRSTLGPEGNWNRCLKESNGKYFKLLPQDDTIHPDTLKRQTDVFETDRDEHISVVFGSRTVISSQGKPLMMRGYPSRREGIIHRDKIIRSCIRRGTNLLGEPGAILIRKSLAKKIGNFDASFPYVIDLDYWIRLLAYGDGYYLTAPPVSAFRVSPTAWSTAIGKDQCNQMTGFVKKAKNWPHVHTSVLDTSLGNIAARINNQLRLVFYKLNPV